MAIAGSGKRAFMEGVDIFENKRMMQAGLMAKTKGLQEELYHFLGVGLQATKRIHTGRTREDANKFFVD